MITTRLKMRREKIVSKIAGSRTIILIGFCGGLPRINALSYEKHLPNYWYE